MRAQGFSFVELLMTLSITAILLTAALPNYKEVLAEQTAEAYRLRLNQALNFARSQAVARGVTVTVCAANSATAELRCQEAWRQNILLYTDDADIADRGNIARSQIIYQIAAPIRAKLYWRAAFHVNYLQFQPSGATNGTNGTFWYCSPNAKTPAWAVIISTAGRIRWEKSRRQLIKYACG